jgi:hypothetical protein
VSTGADRACPRCGACAEPGQEYCLECGLRLPGGGLAAAAGTTWQHRVGRRAPDWLWTLVAGLVVAAVMTGVAIAISRGGDGDAPFLVATTDNTVAAPTTEPGATETETDTEPTVPTDTETSETTPPPPPPRPTIVEWPPSQSGYTVVIASMPTANGRALALRKAREALASGLREVGVLESGEFSSLHPGYYVVFSGIHEDQRAAVRAAPRVQRLYPAAYIRQISR